MPCVRPLLPTFPAAFQGLYLTQPFDDQQLAFSEMFGALETTKPGTVGTGSKVVVLSNFDSDGNIVTANHRQILNGRANQQWHTDSSFKKISAKASVLSASVIPDAGGQTEFVCMRTVYRNLPKAMVLDHGPWGR